jgi:hypothetical protein
VAKILKDLHPGCNPVAKDGRGVWRLDLEDKTVLAYLEQASRRYEKLLMERGDLVERARFIRTARHIYGIELETRGA